MDSLAKFRKKAMSLIKKQPSAKGLAFCSLLLICLENFVSFGGFLGITWSDFDCQEKKPQLLRFCGLNLIVVFFLMCSRGAEDKQEGNVGCY